MAALLEPVELDRLAQQRVGDQLGIAQHADAGLALGLHRDVPDRQADTAGRAPRSSSCGQSITAGLYGLWVSSSIRQNAVLWSSLPGRIAPFAGAAPAPRAVSAAAMIAVVGHGSTPSPARQLAPGRGGAVIDLPGPLPYIAPSARTRAVSRWSRCREAHLPAEQAHPQAPPRLSCANGDPGRPPGARRAPRQGPQAPVRLSARRRRRSRLAGARRSGDRIRWPSACNAQDPRRFSACRRRPPSGGAPRAGAAGGAAARPRMPARRCGSASPPAAGSATRWCATGPSGDCAPRRPRCWRRDGRPGTDYVLIARAGTGARPLRATCSAISTAALRQVDAAGRAAGAGRDGEGVRWPHRDGIAAGAAGLGDAARSAPTSC